MSAPTLASPSVHRTIVGVGEAGASGQPGVVLSAYGLGSCVAVLGYDPVVRAGGLLHVMLPHSKVSPGRALAQPTIFADTGLPELLSLLTALNCSRRSLRFLVTGGAALQCVNDAFQIGARNVAAVTQFLAENNHLPARSVVGGSLSRTVHFQVGTGEVTLKTPVSSETLCLGD